MTFCLGGGRAYCAKLLAKAQIRKRMKKCLDVADA